MRILRNIEQIFRKRGYRTAVLIILVLLLISSPSCFEPYVADIDDEPKLISIEGSLIRGDIEQHVYISITSSIENPVFNPLRGCDVRVRDDLGNELIYEEKSDGSYSLITLEGDLVIDRKYKLSVITGSGKQYESDFMKLVQGVEIDSVYYEIEERVDTYTGANLKGLQFYVDLEAPDSVSRYYRWKLHETYEFTSVGPIDFQYWDLSLTPVVPGDIWALFRCWKGDELSESYLSNTMNLEANEKKKIPLNYVSTETDRLRIKYSLLVYQYSLDEETYEYFQLNSIAEGASGGLYTSQPRQPVTNIQNLNDSTERVLGYFWVSHRTQNRIFVPRIESLGVEPEFCLVDTFSIEDHGAGPFPVPIMVIGGVQMTGASYCFDCTKRGGTTTRPDYWQ